MNRRHFAKLLGLGVFSILPGAGRVWKAQRQTPDFYFLPQFQDFYRLERHPLRFNIEMWNKLITEPTTWLPNRADVQRLVITPDQDLKRPT